MNPAPPASDGSAVPQLLPCPFCGGTDLEQAYGDTVRKWGFIRCKCCGGQAGDVRTSYEDEPHWFAAAAAEWNKRDGWNAALAAQAPEPAQLVGTTPCQCVGCCGLELGNTLPAGIVCRKETAPPQPGDAEGRVLVPNGVLDALKFLGENRYDYTPTVSHMRTLASYIGDLTKELDAAQSALAAKDRALENAINGRNDYCKQYRYFQGEFYKAQSALAESRSRANDALTNP